MNNEGNTSVHYGHQRLREIVCDTAQRRALVVELCKLDNLGFLSPTVVQSMLDHEQHFLASEATCVAIVDFIRQI